MEDIRDVLCKVETIKINVNEDSGQIHENLLQFCENLKYLFLCIKEDYRDNHLDFALNFRFNEYPKLETIQFFGKSSHYHLDRFFELNENVRHLRIQDKFFNRTQSEFLNENFKLIFWIFILTITWTPPK